MDAGMEGRTIVYGTIVYENNRSYCTNGQGTGYNAMEDNGDNMGSKLSRKGNGSAEVGAKRAVHDSLSCMKSPSMQLHHVRTT